MKGTMSRHRIPLRVGFTGSRGPLKQLQRDRLFEFFNRHDIEIAELHHGVCIGGDEECHKIARAVLQEGLHITGHPPISNLYKAVGLDFDELREPKEYLARNKDIVQDTVWLIACPAKAEHLRSGTWHAVRTARRFGKRITIIRASGQLLEEGV